MKIIIRCILLGSFLLPMFAVQADASQKAETEVEVTFVRPIKPNPEQLPGGGHVEESNGTTGTEEVDVSSNEQTASSLNTSNTSATMFFDQNREDIVLTDKTQNINNSSSITENYQPSLVSQASNFPETGTKINELSRWIGGILLIVSALLWKKQRRKEHKNV
ncbi:LPXTG cell wall anchor domain-containing protein [Enterococcus pernyi]|uniref:LPXTG cell wall anchor domain-containing protein n=1 Tax=Enterococcus pernyi TaxID=590158 RepID=UPI000A6E5085|nr:LPXTG cell wall anchor domain-containing protein [Enterococcus pernyi]